MPLSPEFMVGVALGAFAAGCAIAGLVWRLARRWKRDGQL